MKPGHGQTNTHHRPDNTWSPIDCNSNAILRDRGITEARTADHHFEQAAFVALLKEARMLIGSVCLFNPRPIALNSFLVGICRK